MLGQPGKELKRYEIQGDLFSNGDPLFLFDWSDDGGDIAVLKLPKDNGQPHIISMNDVASKNWTTFAGLDLFALGYPSAIDVNGTPIWKKISVASEPSQRVNGTRATLTDGLTFSGMSGGPVLLSQSLGFTDDKTFSIEKEIMIRLVGIYGGRYVADNEKSGTLGFYWPIEIANKITSEDLKVGEIDSF